MIRAAESGYRAHATCCAAVDDHREDAANDPNDHREQAQGMHALHDAALGARLVRERMTMLAEAGVAPRLGAPDSSRRRSGGLAVTRGPG